jgi:hypothetical protein
MRTFRSWVDRMPTSDIEGDLASLEAQREEIDEQIGVLRAALDLKRATGGKVASALQPPGDGPIPGQGPVEPAKKRGREAIRAVIDEYPEKREWTIPQMLMAIRAKGWPANSHSVGVNLSRMFRDGELERPDFGVYVVPLR